MEKRTVLAIAITAGFLLIYPFLLEKMGIVSRPPLKSSTPVSSEPVKNSSVNLSLPSASLIEEKIPAPAKTITLEQDWLKLTIADSAGGVTQAELPRYRDFSNGQDEPLRFFWSRGIGLGWAQDQPGEIQPKISVKLEELSRKTALAQSRFASGVELDQSYQLREGQPALEMAFTWKNPTARPISIHPAIWMGGETVDFAHKEDARLVECTVLEETGKILHRPFHQLGTLEKPVRFAGGLSWLALKGKYFSIVMAPAAGTAQEALFYRTSRGEIRSALVMAPQEIPAGGEVRQNVIVYIGPNNSEILGAAHRGMEKLVAGGIMAAIGQILLSILNGIHSVVRNYGLAIILLTLLVNLCLFPLTAKSMKSMKGLQQLQPKIQKLKETHKNSPEKMNQETLKLYREHKVNPLGGCLPMVLQMPVFIALYQTLVRSVELRGADFLWIRDLSAPDSFWRLPWGIPFIGSHVNLLPLLMIAAMVWQQKLSAKKTTATLSPNDPQKMMATIMPVMFGVLFYHLPAGLVLYWLTNTLIMATYQSQLMRTA